MRHVRMLGLCLVTIFAMSATTLAVASPALAGGCNQECKELKEKEKQEKKELKEKEKQEQKAQKEQEKAERERIKRQEQLEEGKGEWAKFSVCPIPALRAISEYGGCVYGEAGPESFFQAGKVTIHFVKPVQLRGAVSENEETGVLTWYPALNGNTVSKEAEPGPPLTEDIDAELLPEAEKARYEAYLAEGGSTKVTATIELARPQAGGIYVNEANLLTESGEAFVFPVMIHLSNKFVGDHCYVGSTAEPITVPFTTGETTPEPPNTPIHGQLGEIKVIGEGNILQVGTSTKQTILANNEYASPGVHGCGQNGKANAAINSALGLPSPAGSNSTELIGSLFQAGYHAVEERLSV